MLGAWCLARVAHQCLTAPRHGDGLALAWLPRVIDGRREASAALADVLRLSQRLFLWCSPGQSGKSKPFVFLWCNLLIYNANLCAICDNGYRLHGMYAVDIACVLNAISFFARCVIVSLSPATFANG